MPASTTIAPRCPPCEDEDRRRRGRDRHLLAGGAAMEQQRPDAVLVSGEGDLYAHRKLIVLAEKNGLPTMGSYREHVEAGGLRAYGIVIAELFGRMADDVHEILKGTKPGDIPIYQSTKFELLII
jgi:ABC-type uncharacterized transport system substrate-binding protein